MIEMTLKYVCQKCGCKWSIQEDDYCPKCKAKCEGRPGYIVEDKE